MNHYVFGLWNKLLSQEPHCVERYSLEDLRFDDMQDSVAGCLNFTAHYNGFTCLFQYKVNLDDTIDIKVEGLRLDGFHRKYHNLEDVLSLRFVSLESVWSIERTLNFFSQHIAEANNPYNK
jgi:hypothetical protein